MTSSVNVLSIDCGASNGRAIIGKYSGEKLVLKEINRFANAPVSLPTGVYWDVLGIYKGILDSLHRTKTLQYPLSSIGIDTWGVDYGILDNQGNLLANPISYRDQNITKVAYEVHNQYKEYDMFKSSGIYPEPIFTLYQLVSTKKQSKAIIEKAGKIQFISGLLSYFLTGETSCDATQASVSGLYNIHDKVWNKDILEKFCLPDLLPDINSDGQIIGRLLKGISNETGLEEIPVSLVAGHDTSSALLAVPAMKREEVIYISSGSWIMVGCYLDNPIISEEVFKEKFSNEVGYKGEINFLRFHTGLWILQECAKEWFFKEGYSINYQQLENEALEKNFDSFIDVDSEEFAFSGEMNNKIADYCRKTGQQVPKNKAEIYACIINGLVSAIERSIKTIKKLVPRDFKKIHIIGGGSKDKYLCTGIKKLTGMNVYSGPAEASAVGNIVAQLIALNEIQGVNQAVTLISQSLLTDNNVV